MLRTLLLHTACLALLVPGLLTGCGDDPPADPGSTDTTKVPVDTLVEYLSPDTLGIIADERLTELSGIAPSRLRDNLFWMHNDSGDEPRLFAVNSVGRTLAVCSVGNATHEDWEDMASVLLQGTSWLYIGDFGDNDGNRSSVQVYRLQEPEVDTSWVNRSVQAEAERATLSYEDGPRDCEALMVDPVSGDMYLVEKTDSRAAGIYHASWPGDGGQTVLRRVAMLSMPFSFSFFRRVTAADLSADGRSAVFRSYGGIVEHYAVSGRTPDELMAADSSATIYSPALPQAEAVCYLRNGRAIVTGSEGSRQPLVIIPRK
jgi:hypothetical protein